MKRAKKAIKKAVLTTKKVVKKAAQATKKPTNSSSTKVKTPSGDKNRITSEAELKALLDEHRKTRVIGSDGEPITKIADKRKVLSAESTVTPDGLKSTVKTVAKEIKNPVVKSFNSFKEIGEDFKKWFRY